MQNNKQKQKKNILGIVLKCLFFMIVITVIIISSIIIIKAKKNPDEVPDFLGYKPMIVLSGSMETSIYTGDLVFVKEVDPETLKENDIIAFRNEANTVTTHRIIEIITDSEGKKEFRTKGDNNVTEDINLVQEEDIEGVYISRIPKLGNVLMQLKEPNTLVIILLIILVIGLIWLHMADKHEDDEKYRKEFEEFKKRQKNQK